MQRSKVATAARHCQKPKEIEAKRCHSPPFRFNGFGELIRVSPLGEVSLDAGNIVPNGFSPVQMRQILLPRIHLKHEQRRWLGALFLGRPGMVDPSRMVRCISFTAQLELT